MIKTVTALLLCSVSLFVSPISAALIINEVDYDQPGTDNAEFIELFNQNTTDIDLSPYSVALINGNGSSIYEAIALPALNLGAGDYFVICGNSSTVINCDMTASKNTNLIQNGAPDAIALLLNDIVQDSMSYEGNTVGYTEGSGSGLEDDADFDFMGLSLWPSGITSNQNNVDFIFSCITPGMQNTNQSSSCSAPVTASLLNSDLPEPASVWLLGLGLLGLSCHHRYKKARV